MMLWKAGASMEPIQICMLGDFTLTYRDHQISESGNRSRRVWNLLSYIICHRGRTLSQKRLFDQLWGDDAEVTNPESTLRLLLHRTRGVLDQLYEGAGRECILRKDGGYCWNPEIPVVVDFEQFEALGQNPSADPSQRLSQVMEALELYRGEFLSRQSSEDWVIPIGAHFQNQFLLLSQEAAQLLSQAGRYEEAAQICRKAIAAEPYFEPIYQALMQILAAMGNNKGAAEVYDTLSRRLFDDFGIRPSEQTREVYRIAAHSPEDRTLPMDEVLEHLQEPEALPGAMQCDYDYFKVLCYAESRAMERSGSVTHIALLSVSSPVEKTLTKRSLNRIMEQLGTVLRTNLRRGDTISRCSVSQYIIMLPKANYEDSCMVCRRVLGAFHRTHPHVSARIQFLVQPLSPSISIP